MTYDYVCSKCKNVQEEIHRYNERPKIKCVKCNGKCIKMISVGVLFNGVDGTGSMYSFVDTNTTGHPIRFDSKTKWRNHLKSRGLTDDIDQGVPKVGSLKPLRNEKSKEQKRKEYKESIAKVLKEKGILQKYGK